MNTNDRAHYMHEEVWAQFDKAMNEVNEGFRLAGEAMKDVSSKKLKSPCVEKKGVEIPLTLRNRWRLICLAFSFAKWMKL